MIVKNCPALLARHFPSILARLSLSSWYSSVDSIQQIRNSNIKFDASPYSFNLYPFYPQLRKSRGNNIYQISNEQIILAIAILNNQLEATKAWSTRKVVTLKYEDVGKLASLKLNSGQEITMKWANKNKYTGEMREKSLTITDITSEQNFKIKYEDSPIQAKGQQAKKKTKLPESEVITCFMPYSQYRIMHKLIEKSMLDLSGWKMLFDVQKKQTFQKIQKKAEEEKATGMIFEKEDTLQ